MGFPANLRGKAKDILQPDIIWAEGISEMVKICSLASAFDVPVIPHGGSSHVTAHLLASQPPDLCPIQEYLVKWNPIMQFFLKDQIVPSNGTIRLPQSPGLGIVLGESKIASERELSWQDM